MKPVNMKLVKVTGPDGKLQGVFAFHVRDGQMCPYVAAKGRFAKRVRSLTMIASDLKRVASFLKLIRGQIEPELVDALWSAAVVGYARCFVSSEGRGTKLERRDHIQNLSPALLKCHDFILNARHNFVAHAGDTKMEQSAVHIVLQPQSSRPGVIGVGLPQTRRQAPASPEVDVFINLTEAVLVIVEALLGEATKALQDDYNSLDIETLYAQAIFPPPDTAHHANGGSGQSL